MDLKPKAPKNIKHVVDLPVQDPPSDKKKSEKKKKKKKAKKTKPEVTETKALTKKPKYPDQHHFEVSKDAIPPVDLTSPGAFSTHRDPFSIDFEKIAMRRAAKQHEF